MFGQMKIKTRILGILALLAGGYLAIASMTSALTRNQVISFILSVVICFYLVLCGWEPVTHAAAAPDTRNDIPGDCPQGRGSRGSSCRRRSGGCTRNWSGPTGCRGRS